MPDTYDAHLREIFPDVRRGSFTYRPEIDRWVWTTFHSFQWDLNYRNPVVFNRMAEEMLFLANAGVEALRLDAVAFTWKQLGTSCENLPEAHLLIQAFNALARIAAPALLFKSEAIVHPDDVARYIAPGECQLSYNPLLMALLWETLATREARLLRFSMQRRFRIDPGCAWVNYVRCHDDIGWTFSDEDAWQLGIKGFDHRQFLNAFYTGRFEGSFARGLPFQFNPATRDMRISGSCASLAGLEQALREGDEEDIELAVRRILLIHGVILSIGGIPLIYLGDEVGTLNDYSYRDDPAKADDSRWVHRPAVDWDRLARRRDESTVEGRIYTRLRRLIDLRQANPAFGGGETQIIDVGNPYVFGYAAAQGSAGAGARQLCRARAAHQRQRVAAPRPERWFHRPGDRPAVHVRRGPAAGTVPFCLANQMSKWTNLLKYQSTNPQSPIPNPQAIALGELLIDFVSTESGVTLIKAPTFQKAAGGAPANVAVGLARLGVPSGFIGKVGDDDFGRFLAQTLDENGVDTSALRFSSEARTMLAFVSLGPDGDREFMFYRHPSADMLLRPEEIDPDYIGAARALHYGSISLISEPSRSATLAAVRIAQEHDLLISYDPNRRLALWPSVEIARERMLEGLQFAQVAKVSRRELSFLSGESELGPAVERLWHDRLRLLVITEGPAGCRYITRDTRGHVPGYRVTPVDTTGAGDGFVAGLLAGLLGDEAAWENVTALEETLRFANAAGALTTTRRGAIPALPTRAQVEKFMGGK